MCGHVIGRRSPEVEHIGVNPNGAAPEMTEVTGWCAGVAEWVTACGTRHEEHQSMRARMRLTTGLAAAAIALGGLTACSGDDDDTTEIETETSTAVSEVGTDVSEAGSDVSSAVSEAGSDVSSAVSDVSSEVTDDTSGD
jgi:hypothetical protein